MKEFEFIEDSDHHLLEKLGCRLLRLRDRLSDIRAACGDNTKPESPEPYYKGRSDMANEILDVLCGLSKYNRRTPERLWRDCRFEPDAPIDEEEEGT